MKLHAERSDYRGGNHTEKYQGQINLGALRLSHLKDSPGSTLWSLFLYFYGPDIVASAHLPFQRWFSVLHMIMNISIDMLRGSASAGDGDDNVALRGDKDPNRT